MLTTWQKVKAHLEGYGLQDKGGGKWRCISPLRPDAQAHNFALLINDGEHGTWRDWYDGNTGTLYELAALLGIEIESKRVDSTERNYSGLADYAKAHALTESQLAKAGWEEITHQNRRALKFKTNGGFRFRFLDDKKPKYKSDYGCKACWFGLNATLLERLQDGSPLVLVNGEISVIASRYHKIPAACVTMGEKKYSQQMIDELLSFLGALHPEIWIAMDADKTGREASKAIAEQFSALGFIVREIDLGLEGKGDITDFCLLYGEDALMRLHTCNQIERTERKGTIRKLYHADELINLPKVSYIIPNEIPTHSLVMVVGRSGVGKSFVTLDYALRMAQDNTVVYVAGEGQAGFMQRVEAWKKHHNSPSGNLFFFLHSLAILSPEEFADFTDLIKPLLPDVIVIDTLARAMLGADENSQRDMGKFVDACNRLSEILGCTVILVHHTSKAGVEYRGSTVLQGSLDVSIGVDQRDDLLEISCKKSKDGRPFDTRYMRLLPVSIEIQGECIESVVVVHADKTPQRKADGLSQGQAKMLTFLNLSIYADNGAGWGDIKNLSEIPSGSIGKILSTLKDLGYVQKTGESYKITDTGKEKLDPSVSSISDTDDDTE